MKRKEFIPGRYHRVVEGLQVEDGISGPAFVIDLAKPGKRYGNGVRSGEYFTGIELHITIQATHDHFAILLPEQGFPVELIGVQPILGIEVSELPGLAVKTT